MSKYTDISLQRWSMKQKKRDDVSLTPHVKAKHLITLFWSIHPIYHFGTGENNYDEAKEYAKICAIEVLNCLPMYKGKLNPDWEFWQKVKSEIEVL